MGRSSPFSVSNFPLSTPHGGLMPGPCFPGAITAAPSSLFPLCFQESTYISEMQREESFGTHPVLNIRALAVPCSAFERGLGGIFKDCTGSHCPRPLLLTAFILVCWVAKSSQQHVPSSPPSLCLCTPSFSTLRGPKGERCLFTENPRSPAAAQTSKAAFCHLREMLLPPTPFHRL